MELATAVNLIKKGVPQNSWKQVWADLGSGGGTFTRALATLLSSGSTIHAIDKNPQRLDAFNGGGEVHIKVIQKDFVLEAIGENEFDGLLMANSLHYVVDKHSFFGSLKKSLRNSGRLILVEYDTDATSPWVPFPVSYRTLQDSAPGFGFSSVIKLGETPSLYNVAKLYAAALTI